jgi:hypothetical protein
MFNFMRFDSKWPKTKKIRENNFYNILFVSFLYQRQLSKENSYFSFNSCLFLKYKFKFINDVFPNTEIQHIDFPSLYLGFIFGYLLLIMNHDYCRPKRCSLYQNSLNKSLN